MNGFDPSAADALIAKVLGTLTIISGGGFVLWRRFYRTRRDNSADNGDRKRFEDAIEDARAARKEAHDANNAAMSVQRQMGRLEAENDACNKRADRQDIEIAALKVQNAEQAQQIRDLTRILRARYNPTATDNG